MHKYFKIQIDKACEKLNKWYVYRPASINNPLDNSVMFINSKYIEKWEGLLKVKECLVFWPKEYEIPSEIKKRHYFVECDNPRLEYALFFENNGINSLQKNVVGEYKNGSFIANDSIIGNNVNILPGCYIGNEVTIGNGTYIGSGVKIVGRVEIGENVIIHENTVIGADGLSMERNENGRMITIPQFGGVVIEDNVRIAANVVIARGAIEDTVIGKGCILDNSSFISHNVRLGKNVAIVGESILFGSVSVGQNSFISGNVTIRDGIQVGENAFIGMGAVVVNNVNDNDVVVGAPARSKLKREEQEK